MQLHSKLYVGRHCFDDHGGFMCLLAQSFLFHSDKTPLIVLFFSQRENNNPSYLEIFMGFFSWRISFLLEAFLLMPLTKALVLEQDFDHRNWIEKVRIGRLLTTLYSQLVLY